jgi:plastocyanin
VKRVAISALHGALLLHAAVAAVLVSMMGFAERRLAPPVSAAQSGRIDGQVRLIMPAVNAVPSGVYPSRRVSRPAARTPEIGNVIVFLKDAPRQSELPVTRATIVQKDEAFVPRVVAITRGSTVDFPNSDPFFHNVFSLSRGANFDLGRFPRGETRGWRFTSPGLVKVYCHIHSHMSASIMVFDHAYFRIPSADGNFTIDDVPAGTYQVSAWHERVGESVSPVRVEAGRSARLEFVVPVEHQ